MIKNFSIGLGIKLYVVLALGTAVVLSPLIFSPLVLVFLAASIYFIFRPPQPILRLALSLYLFLALPLIYELIIGWGVSPLLSIPVLWLLDSDLRRLASSHRFQDSKFKRCPSKRLTALALVTVLSLVISAFLGKTNLIIVSAVLAGYLLFLIGRVFTAIPEMPIETDQRRYRVVAGHTISFTAQLHRKSRLAGWLYLVSPYEWVKMKPDKLSLSQAKAELDVSLTPPLAGPSTVYVTGFVVDRWGLIQCKFQMPLAELYVIPRARYAVWLARKYLETTKAGAILTVATLAAFKASTGSRRGVEYYGNRLYYPGDSLRSIDWKHSLKFSELVVKEFDDPRASQAVLLVNLAVANPEEADRLIYTWVTTCITLAREGIPTMLATYDHEDVRLATGVLDPRETLLRSLTASRDVVLWEKPQKYLQHPDPTRIKADTARLRSVGTGSLAKLAELLELEFKALSESAASNPLTKALNQVLAKASSRPTVLFLSAKNHDEEALAINKYNLFAYKHDFTEIPLS